MKKRTQFGLVMTSVAMTLGSASVNAAELEITVTNATKGIYFTPLIVAAHGSDLQMFRTGEVATPELEAMAEGGDTSGLASLIGNAGGVVVENPASGILNPRLLQPLSPWTVVTMVIFLLARCCCQPTMVLWG